MVRAGSQSLVLGILAYQTSLITREGLLAALGRWTPDHQTPLGQILVEDSSLSSEERQLLEALVDRHLQRFDDDAERCLSALLTTTSAKDVIEQWDAATRDPHATWALNDGPISVGMPTSIGGRFQILGPHARGGLGEVLLALDTELNRQVALKQMQSRGACQSQMRSRFVLEAEVTGRLEHPGIVPVYALGAYDDGRPYYVMRFIRGESLQQAIEKFHRVPGLANLELRHLLGKLMSVCDAVAYAHSRGVLHRDIKPGNIMLGPFGETLVVDWGLAKLIATPADLPECSGPLQAAPGSAATQPGAVMGTPAYMSPEQAVGLESIGPASDVYSLGATLFSLLTGRTALAEHDPVVLLKKLQRGDFPAPRSLNPLVPPPLEAICLKAMATQPQDRYASASELKADLEHWLADEPVSAYSERLTERATRWTRKHRGATRAAAIALMAVTLISATAALLVDRERRRADDNARVAGEQRDAAENERRQATQWGGVANHQRRLALTILNGLVFDLQTKLSDRPGLQGLREELLSQAVSGLDEVAETFEVDWQPAADSDEQADDYERTYVEGYAHTQHQSADLLKAVAVEQMGDIMRSAGRRQEAVRRYQQGHAIMLSIWQEQPTMHDGVRAFLAHSHDRLGHSHEGLGNLAAAEREFDAAMTLREAAAASQPGRATPLRELAWTYRSMGEVLFQQGRLPSAFDRYRRALKLFEIAAEMAPLESDRQTISRLLDDLGLAALRMGNAAMAQEFHSQALQRRLADAAADGDTPHRSNLARSYITLGNCCVRLEDYPVALDYFLLALPLHESLLAVDPISFQAQRDLRVTLNRLGHAYTQLRQYEAAREYVRRELEIAKKLASLDPGGAQAQTNLSASYSNLAMLEGLAGNPLEAARLGAVALGIEAQVRLAGKSTQTPLLPNWAERAMQLVDPRRAALVSNVDLPPETPREIARELLLLHSTILSSRGDHVAAAQVAEKLHASFHDKDALYDAARCFALADSPRRAVETLQQAVELGFTNWQRLHTDPDLRALQAWSGYGELIQRLATQPAPSP